MQNRREFLGNVAAIGALAGIPVFAAKGNGTIGLGLGNYGLKMYATEKAIQFINGLGYDSVEFALMPGYTTEPVKVPAEERRKIRSLVGSLGLAVPCLLETIAITGDESAHKAALERLRRDAQFGHDVNAGVGGIEPSVQTHLGGATKD
ncbi:MAG: twin-arginine translocation signal domain-containing protein, partial [Bryobacteraceae bacterium]